MRAALSYPIEASPMEMLFKAVWLVVKFVVLTVLESGV